MADLLLAKAIKEFREDREWTQEQVASEAGLTASIISRIECGLNDSKWEIVKKIATAIGVHVADFALAVEDAKK